LARGIVEVVRPQLPPPPQPADTLFLADTASLADPAAAPPSPESLGSILFSTAAAAAADASRPIAPPPLPSLLTDPAAAGHLLSPAFELLAPSGADSLSVTTGAATVAFASFGFPDSFHQQQQQQQQQQPQHFPPHFM
ncbi:hypothetical protein HK405_015498, partial [Cladochytrium tenue]